MGRYHSVDITSPPGPAWLRWLIGDDAFARVIGVTINNQDVADKDVALLEAFPNLKYLDLSRSRLTDKGLKDVAKLPHLESLVIIRTRVTATGLEALRECKTLRELFTSPDIGGSKVDRLSRQLGISASNSDFRPLGKRTP